MPKLSQIRLSNSKIGSSSFPRVAVFVGGTSGIGKITLGALATAGHKFKVYVVGRKASEEAFKIFAADLSETVEIVWNEGEVSLLAEVKRICEDILSREESIDLLFLTTGYAPFAGRENTSEGIDTSHALSLYSRFFFITKLLPLLRASEHARVISVHSGGLETACLLNIEDLALEKSGAFGAMATQLHMCNMGTLTLERLAEMPENQGIVFVHSHPGIVRTGNVYRGWKEGAWGPWLMDPVLMLFAFSWEESAARHLYLVTSGTLGGLGPELQGSLGQTTRGEERGGLFLVNRHCDTVRNEKELSKLRTTAGDAVWMKVQEIISPHI